MEKPNKFVNKINYKTNKFGFYLRRKDKFFS